MVKQRFSRQSAETRAVEVGELRQVRDIYATCLKGLLSELLLSCTM